MRWLFSLFLLMSIFGCGPSMPDTVQEPIFIRNDSLARTLQIRDSIYDVHQFSPQLKYRPVSLFINGRSLLRIGQRRRYLAKYFDYRMDPNGRYDPWKDHIWSYMAAQDPCGDPSDGSANGMVCFSADDHDQHIFALQASFLLDGTADQGQDLLDCVQQTYFPEIPQRFEFEDGWQYSYASRNVREVFKVQIDTSGAYSYNLYYNVILY